jgi:flagellar hook-basal body complex protein FliE
MPVAPIDGGSLPLLSPHALRGIEARPDIATPGAGAPAEVVSFGDVFANMVASANNQGHLAQAKAVALAEGRSDDIHGTMIELQKAGIEMRLVGNIKNKVVDAFYEIWRMNI